MWCDLCRIYNKSLCLILPMKLVSLDIFLTLEDDLFGEKETSGEDVSLKKKSANARWARELLKRE